MQKSCAACQSSTRPRPAATPDWVSESCRQWELAFWEAVWAYGPSRSSDTNAPNGLWVHSVCLRPVFAVLAKGLGTVSDCRLLVALRCTGLHGDEGSCPGSGHPVGTSEAPPQVAHIERPGHDQRTSRRSKRPDRSGHWEGDLLMGKRQTAIGTLVERWSHESTNRSTQPTGYRPGAHPLDAAPKPPRSPTRLSRVRVRPLSRPSTASELFGRNAEACQHGLRRVS